MQRSSLTSAAPPPRNLERRQKPGRSLEGTASNAMREGRNSGTNRTMTGSRSLTGGADAPLPRRSELVLGMTRGAGNLQMRSAWSTNGAWEPAGPSGTRTPAAERGGANCARGVASCRLNSVKRMARGTKPDIPELTFPHPTRRGGRTIPSGTRPGVLPPRALGARLSKRRFGGV